MSILTRRQTNKIFILWDPVPVTSSPFTPAGQAFAPHVMQSSWIELNPSGVIPPLDPNIPKLNVDTSMAHYKAMLKMARQSPPDQSWFDEDFTSLRHPGK